MSWPGRDLGELMAQFQSNEWQAQDPGRIDVSIQLQEKVDVPVQRQSGKIQRKVSLFVSFGPSTVWMRAI